MAIKTGDQPMQELLDRVKAAAGPDRELSRDIFQALDTPEWKAAYMSAQEPCGCPHEQAVEYAIRHLPDITASIDAAIALVERVLPGWKRSLWEKRGGGWIARVSSPRWETYTSGEDEPRPTAPLAILVALLTALKDASQ